MSHLSVIKKRTGICLMLTDPLYVFGIIVIFIPFIMFHVCKLSNSGGVRMTPAEVCRHLLNSEQTLLQTALLTFLVLKCGKGLTSLIRPQISHQCLPLTLPPPFLQWYSVSFLLRIKD